ncbi:hypothetical protein [Latilactobacillus sakei]|uniref:hypothetical protein n=1 Tax=Latilactobacillus sakei TaxID=1599 RepID=UPI00202E4E82|nr:hypothetical protein [Latilactobacillus sakei]MCM1635833.1 hypothetical protein [Latilactobacillus sakei]
MRVFNFFSLSSDVAEVLYNIFYKGSGMGSWLEKNGPGSVIFNYSSGTGGEKSAQDISNILSKDPTAFIYSSTMTVGLLSFVDYFNILMVALAVGILTYSVMINSIKLGYGQIFKASESRAKWLESWIDFFEAVIGITLMGTIINYMLQINGVLLYTIKSFIISNPLGDGSFLDVVNLGFSTKYIDGLISNEKAGVIFVLIYIGTTVGLTVWVKYYYIMRAVVFSFLLIIGPIQIAMWTFESGKQRTLNWFKETFGVIIIQSVHALVISMLGVMLYTLKVSTESIKKAAENTQSKKGGVLGDYWQMSVDAWHQLSLLHPLKGGYNYGYQLGLGYKSIVDDIKNGRWGTGHSKPSTTVIDMELMIGSFIVMILFQPISKALAEQLGISTNMLDAVHQKTSSTLTTMALIAGEAAVAAATGGLGLVAGASGVQNAAKAGSGNMASGMANKLLGSQQDGGQNPQLAQMLGGMSAKQKAAYMAMQTNGIIGAAGGKLLGAAVGAGAGGNTFAMLGLSRAGGVIGQGNAKLANLATTLGFQKFSDLASKKSPELLAEQAQDENNSTIRNDAEETPKSLKDRMAQAAKMVRHPSLLRDALRNNSKKDTAKINDKLFETNQDGYSQHKNLNAAVGNANSKLMTAEAFDNAKSDGTALNKTYIADKAKATGFDLNSFSESNKADFMKNYQQQNPTSSAKEANTAWLNHANEAMNQMPTIATMSQIASESAGAATTSSVSYPSSRKQIRDQATKDFAQQQAVKYNAENGNLEGFSDYMKTPEYRQAGSAFVANKLNSSSVAPRKVLNHSDQTYNPNMQNSYVNVGQYGASLKNQMASAGYSPSVINTTMGALQQVKGTALSVPTDNGQVINGALSNQLHNQAVWTQNNGNRHSLRQVSQSAKTVIANATGSLMSSEAIQRRTDPRFTQANYEDNLSMIGAAIGGANGYMVGKQHAQKSNRFGHVADKFTLDANQISDSVQRSFDPRTQTQHIASGALRAVTDNRSTRLIMRDQSGQDRQVSRFAAGDSSLNGNERIEVPLDIVGNTVIPKMDMQTHQPELAQRYSADNSSRSVAYNSPIDYNTLLSGGNGRGVRVAQRSTLSTVPANEFVESGQFTVSEAMRNQDYSDIRFEGDRYRSAITAYSDSMNRRVALSPAHNGWAWMDPGIKFSQPLVGNSATKKWEPSPESKFVLESADGTRIADQSNRNYRELNTIFGSPDKTQATINKYMPPIQMNERNTINSYAAFRNITLLDFKNKVWR